MRHWFQLLGTSMGNVGQRAPVAAPSCTAFAHVYIRSATFRIPAGADQPIEGQVMSKSESR